MEKFTFDIQVRGYELDSFGHVNNAVYVNYLEQARWDILKTRGWYSFFKQNNLFLVVIENNLKYIRELIMFDQITVVSTYEKKDPYLMFYQDIIRKKDGVKVLKSIVKTLIVDNERIPHDLPNEIFS